VTGGEAPQGEQLCLAEPVADAVPVQAYAVARPQASDEPGGAADRPLGPAPMISTRLPVGSVFSIPNGQWFLVARSPRNLSTEWTETALSSSLRLHTLSHGW